MMRQRVWRVAQTAILHPASWRRNVFGILVLLSFAHVPLLAVIAAAFADPFTWQMVGTAVALVAVTLAMRNLPSTRIACAVLSTVLVLQATLLV